MDIETSLNSNKLAAKYVAQILTSGYYERSKWQRLQHWLKQVLRVHLLLPFWYILQLPWTKKGRRKLESYANLNRQHPSFALELALALQSIYQERQIQSGQKPPYIPVCSSESPLESSISRQDSDVNQNREEPIRS